MRARWAQAPAAQAQFVRQRGGHTPNGFHGPDKDWQRMETPLRSVDPDLEDYARRHAMSVSRNYHSWPERTLSWGGAVHRSIQVYLDDPKALTWHVWLCAYEDRGRKRYWKNAFLLRAVPMTEISRDLSAVLDRGRQLVDGWTAPELEFATELTG